MLALLLLVFTIGFLPGENLRDHLYGEKIEENEDVSEKDRITGVLHKRKGKKWRLYTGLFILLKHKWPLSKQEWQLILETAFESLRVIACPPVPAQV